MSELEDLSARIVVHKKARDWIEVAETISKLKKSDEWKPIHKKWVHFCKAQGWSAPDANYHARIWDVLHVQLEVSKKRLRRLGVSKSRQVVKLFAPRSKHTKSSRLGLEQPLPAAELPKWLRKAAKSTEAELRELVRQEIARHHAVVEEPEEKDEEVLSVGVGGVRAPVVPVDERTMFNVRLEVDERADIERALDVAARMAPDRGKRLQLIALAFLATYDETS